MRCECSQCGKIISRYNEHRKKTNLHFCERDCMNEYLRKHGSFPNTKNPQRNQTVKIHCDWCGEPVVCKSLRHKYCDDCKPITKGFYFKNKKTNISFKQYLMQYKGTKFKEQIRKIFIHKFGEDELR